MDIENTIQEIMNSKKYGHLCYDTIKRVAEEESLKHKNHKETIKAVKNKLHQIYGAFLVQYDIKMLFECIEKIKQGQPLENMCQQILSMHVSTSERLGVYDKLYKRIFSVTGQPSSIIDFACGLNPFSFPWMGLNAISYYAYDIDELLIDAINEFFETVGLEPKAAVQDVVLNTPGVYADVAFVFKFLPTVERQKLSYLDFLLRINAAFIIVSFPCTSIGGKNKGMSENYSRRMEDCLTGVFDILSCFTEGNEKFYIIKRG